MLKTPFRLAVAVLLVCVVAGSLHGRVTAPTLEEMAGQMLIVGFRGETVTDETAAMLADVRPGGVILFDYDLPSRGAEKRNISSPPQLKRLISDLQSVSGGGLFIAADVEGGKVNRLKNKYGFATDIPSAKKLGSSAPERTYEAAAQLARTLRSVGINLNFAPVVDVDTNPQSPAIGLLERAFSSDPETVARHALEFVNAHEQYGVATVIKHFPGHGSAAGDTHLGVVDITRTYDAETELLPYGRLIKKGAAHAVMAAHGINKKVDGKPASLSSKTLTGLLRGELGFDGVIVSDDMQMGAIMSGYGLAEAAVLAVSAGVDIVVIGNQLGDYNPDAAAKVRDAIVRAVPEHRIVESYRRIKALKRRYGI